jgi:quercetin dioxygenase-like cupin family protein
MSIKDMRSLCLVIVLGSAVALVAQAPPAARNTVVSIAGREFLINGHSTYEARSYDGMTVQGLLFNSRMVQGIFDDRNATGTRRRASTYRVTFQPAARTAWHSHSGVQLLLVIEGRCRVQKAGEPVHEVAAGGAIRIEPGERHCHGAATDGPMTHLALNIDAATECYRRRVHGIADTSAADTPGRRKATCPIRDGRDNQHGVAGRDMSRAASQSGK